jgi:hypothetical protein
VVSVEETSLDLERRLVLAEMRKQARPQPWAFALRTCFSLLVFVRATCRTPLTRRCCPRCSASTTS